jgi:U3 small nucleolar RNA-associated protein 14
MLMASFPGQAERSAALAARISGDSSQEENESILQVTASVLLLLGLQTQQVIALSFKDKAAVNELQQEKVDIAQSFREYLA